MTRRPSHEPVEILLVEDNPGDVDLMREAFKESTVLSRLTVAADGEEALSFLRAQTGFCPDIVILDLNLPKKDGREVLAEMKADIKLRTIPVVIFSSSEAERDLQQAYALHANCFVTKAVDLEMFLASVRAIADFWLVNARLPPRAWGN
jgi:two-component system, chemotaxis family, response regulator Rcp1